MRYLKMLCLAFGAMAAMSAIAGAGTAGATLLCPEPSCAKDYAAGTKMSVSLKSGTSAVFTTTEGTTLNTCNGTTIEGSTANTGGSGIAVKSATAEWSFKNCTSSTTTIKNGELEVTRITGTNNGTVVARGYEITVQTIFGSCVFGPGTGTDIGTLIGGSAVMKVNSVLQKISGLCPSTGRWSAEYTVTSPSPLYVGG
jgi:hypothetical protein